MINEVHFDKIMSVRYLFLLVIPAFFALSSCTREERKIEGFFDFSNDPGIQKELLKDEEETAVDTAEKPEEAAPEQVTGPVEAKPQKVAKPLDKTLIRKYNIGYLTFDVADVYGEFKALEKTSDYTRYSFRFYSKSNGMIDYLFGWMSHTVSTMKVYKNKVVPEKFRTKSILKKKTREIALDYSSGGKNIVFDQVTPPDNRGKRPAVPDDMKVGTYDPLTAAIEARRIVMQAFRENNFNDRNKYSFSLPVYDGRRRSDVNFILDEKMVDGLYHLKFYQKAIAGYTDNEWKEIKKGERVIDLYLDPTNFWPVSAVGRSPLGSAKAKFIETCSDKFQECIKLKK